MSGTGSNQANNQARFVDQDEELKLMEKVVGHYLDHRQVVLKKLLAAHEATTQSIHEIKEICQRFGLSEKLEPFAEIMRHEHTWEGIIDVFQEAGVTEEELDRIEDVLVSIPRAIRDHYTTLIHQDRELASMINKLNSDEYKNAINKVRHIQSSAAELWDTGANETPTFHSQAFQYWTNKSDNA